MYSFALNYSFVLSNDVLHGIWYWFVCFFSFFFFKQKTAYEMRISDWSSDVCSSDLGNVAAICGTRQPDLSVLRVRPDALAALQIDAPQQLHGIAVALARRQGQQPQAALGIGRKPAVARLDQRIAEVALGIGIARCNRPLEQAPTLCRIRSEEHTSELQSLMRISYAVFCLKKK